MTDPLTQPGMVDMVAFAIIDGSAGTRAAEHAREFVTANWTDALRSARAALEAMREPSLDMLNAGRDAYLRTQRHGVSGMTIDAQIRNECVREGAAYRAMIDAALSQGGE